jgi:hypothetical protein
MTEKAGAGVHRAIETGHPWPVPAKQDAKAP